MRGVPAVLEDAGDLRAGDRLMDLAEQRKPVPRVPKGCQGPQGPPRQHRQGGSQGSAGPCRGRRPVPSGAGSRMGPGRGTTGQPASTTPRQEQVVQPLEKPSRRGVSSLRTEGQELSEGRMPSCTPWSSSPFLQGHPLPIPPSCTPADHPTAHRGQGGVL